MRVPGGVKHGRRRRKVLQRTKGFQGKRRSCYRIAKQSVFKAQRHMYVSRKLEKRTMRRLWMVRIGAAAKGHGLSYSAFMGGLHKAGVGLNRKMLADIAQRDPQAFSQVVTVAREMRRA
ncbi:MAG TPA: 50S ribosomal protein L20 [Candidatus Bipolaricaulis sp.]|nr:50S ribosomal protein L20 [Candidatus Bipolaricaulis sp.]HRS14510.1 50S ribosomal protein L20 [Candidatus Bipolaricaulis sp.]HRU21328.1 50S ribosomal protein L20 [Candidatus Bipolaricaulis sp.]